MFHFLFKLSRYCRFNIIFNFIILRHFSLKGFFNNWDSINYSLPLLHKLLNPRYLININVNTKPHLSFLEMGFFLHHMLCLYLRLKQLFWNHNIFTHIQPGVSRPLEKGFKKKIKQIFCTDNCAMMHSLVCILTRN